MAKGRELRKILPLIVVLVLAAGAAFIYWTKTQHSAPAAAVSSTNGTPGGSAAAAPSSGPAILNVTSDDEVMGKADAPVTMIEYASLTCPHCAHFEGDIFPQIKSAYIDTGKLRFVYRDFPLDALAVRAAVLAHCAGHERFFGFLQVLFQNQPTWEQAEQPESALAGIAKLGGIGKDQFDHCMADDSLTKRVTQSRLDAEQNLEIESTPTFFINGKKISGAQPYEAFQSAIDPLLPKP